MIIVVILVLLILVAGGFLLYRQMQNKGVEIPGLPMKKQNKQPERPIEQKQAQPQTVVEEIPQNQAEEIITETEIDQRPDNAASLGYDAACAQTIGAREDQEDSCWLSDWKNPAVVEKYGLAAVVADGIGGIADGQVASKAAVKAISERFAASNPSASLSDRLLAMAAGAQREVLAANRGSKCGSTLVSVLIKDRKMELVSVGDSRIYLCRQGSLLQLNRAHVLGKEIDESNAFGWGAADADARRRKALTAYLGKDNLRQIDRTIHPMRLISGDRVLLMSDGVFGALTEDEILSCVQAGAMETARKMIQMVVEKNLPGQDNATVAVVEVK